MTLVVLGKESLPQLQRTVDGLFSPVPNRGTGLRPSNKWLGKVKPFFSNQPPQAFNVVPVQVRTQAEINRDAYDAIPRRMYLRLADRG